MKRIGKVFGKLVKTKTRLNNVLLAILKMLFEKPKFKPNVPYEITSGVVFRGAVFFRTTMVQR
jgi:hypothetical protein